MVYLAGPCPHDIAAASNFAGAGWRRWFVRTGTRGLGWPCADHQARPVRSVCCCGGPDGFGSSDAGSRAAHAGRAPERAHQLFRAEIARRRLLLRRDRPEALQVLHADLAAALLDIERHAAHRLRLPAAGRSCVARAHARAIKDFALVPWRLLRRRGLCSAPRAALRKQLPLSQRTLRSPLRGHRPRLRARNRGPTGGMGLSRPPTETPRERDNDGRPFRLEVRGPIAAGASRLFRGRSSSRGAPAGPPWPLRTQSWLLRGARQPQRLRLPPQVRWRSAAARPCRGRSA
jgi:hypothetical protein